MNEIYSQYIRSAISPLFRISMSEEDARKKGLNIKVNKLSVAAILRAITLGALNDLMSF